MLLQSESLPLPPPLLLGLLLSLPLLLDPPPAPLLLPPVPPCSPPPPAGPPARLWMGLVSPVSSVNVATSAAVKVRSMP